MARKQKGLSIIDKDSAVEGTLNIKGKLIVAGRLKGTLLGDTVVTAKDSHVDVKARVREMTIGGEFRGDIIVYERLNILKTGVFTGRVACRDLSLEAGGKLNGRVVPFEEKDAASGRDLSPSAENGAMSSAPTTKGAAKEADMSMPGDP